MTRTARWAAVASALAGGILWWAISGCETVESYDRVLEIVPSSTNLTAAAETVVFVAMVNSVSNLAIAGINTNEASTLPPAFLPLSWSVSAPNLGRIRASGGLTAVYERNGEAEGNNYIIVRDRSGRYEAVATVRQLPVP